jgi:chromate transport protein ChrA
VNAKAILFVAAGCIIFGIGMGVREMFTDTWVRAAIAGVAAASGVLVAATGQRLWPNERSKGY